MPDAQVIPFPVPPPPAARALLQPSIYARGVRNFAFSGRIDDWHAPGVVISKDGTETRAAIDAAWLVERVLGAPRRRPEIWPGVPGVRERAIAYGAHVGLAPFQQEGAAFLAERDYGLLIDEMGCLSGDARVFVSRKDGQTSEWVMLEQLYEKFNGEWDHTIETRVCALGANGKLKQHRIFAVLYRGKRQTLRVVTDAGQTLQLTHDHEICTESGDYEAIEKLHIGDRLRVQDHKSAATNTAAITEIAPAGETDVYDIVCHEPYRNFVANGIIVHNCGKTPQAIVAAEARLSMGVIPDPQAPAVLVICPAIAKRHWQREIKRWSGHDSVILDTRTPDPEQLCARYVICNYDILFGGRERDAAGVMHDLTTQPGWGKTLMGRFLIAIADEAHILRGRSALRTKSTKATLLKIPVVWGLTGTPMPNYVRDLFALVDTMSNGLWGYSYWDWAKAYCNAYQGQYGWVDTGSSRVDELQGRLGFFTLGRSAKGVHLQLPEKRREVYRVDVQVTAPSVAEGNKALSKSNAVANALRYTARAKRSAVVSAAVEALQAKQKVVVFLYMREQADAVAKDIRKHVDCNVMCVHGDLPPSGRDAQAQTFRESSAPTAFVATIDSMGVALSLVGAHLVIFGDLVPEPWKLLQAEKRTHRFDSVERVLVRYMIATGTIDEGIAESVIEKIPIIEQALGEQEDASELTKMLGGKSTEEIVDTLFAKLKAWGEASGG